LTGATIDMVLTIKTVGANGKFLLNDTGGIGGFSAIRVSPSLTPSITPTISLTPTPSITLTPTPSITPSRTLTPTPSITPSRTLTPTPSITPSRTLTPTPSITPTRTITPSITPSRTLTPTPSITPSISVSTVVGGLTTDNLILKLDASDTNSYPGTGTTWTDLVGDYDATINGATWSSTDGGIFDLDGINDTISIPHSSSLSLNSSTQKTIQVWVKFDALGELNQQIPVFGKLSSNFAFDGYWGGLFSNGGAIRVVTNGTAAQRISTSTLTVTTNTWYLFTFISQITNTSNTTKVYINTTEYISTAHGTDGYTESNPLYLGYIGTGVSSLYLNGKIGACYFYTKGLSAAEVSTNYNATKTRYGL